VSLTQPRLEAALRELRASARLPGVAVKGFVSEATWKSVVSSTC